MKIWMVIARMLQLCSCLGKQIYRSEEISFHISGNVDQSISELPPNTTVLFKVRLQVKDPGFSSLQVHWMEIEVLPICILSEDLQKFQYYLDYEAIITGSENHYLQYFKNENTTTDRLYLQCGDANKQYTQFLLQYDVEVFDGQIHCINGCSLNGYCNRQKKCSCQQNYFGSYCQFQREMVTFSKNMDIKLRPYSWKYFAVDIQSMETENLFMEVSELKNELKISFGYNGITNSEIPSIHQEVFQIIPDPRESYETYSLITQVAKYKYHSIERKITKDQILYIGFYNFNIDTVMFELLFRDKEETKFQIFLRRNYIFLIILATNVIIAFTFLCFQSHFSDEDQERVHTTIQDNQQQIRVRRIVRRKVQGFHEKFIDTHFPPYNYHQITINYPALCEIQECVICLEPMNSQENQNENENEPQESAHQVMENQKLKKQEKSKSQCSVTPCYHMFHHHCLKTWLMTQRYCPVCRENYNEQQIQSMKKWLIFSIQSVTNKDKETFRKTSLYVQRMKQNKSAINSDNSFAGQSQIQLKQGCDFSQMEISIQTQNEERKRQEVSKMNTEESPKK